MATRRRSIAPGIPLVFEDRELFEKVRKKGAQAICFFNNKGGVGKTTLVANIAAELSLNFGARILVIDRDPQCNLSQYVLGQEESITTYSGSLQDSIYSVIRPISLGKGYGERLPTRHSETFGFDIIIGDPRLALQEDLLAGDWRDAKGGGMRGIRTTYIFADVVHKAKEMGYDFIFFDMGPSLGAINRSILLAMDFFIVPMTIDIFSVWAIKNIGATVGIWQKELKTGLTLAEDRSEIPEVDQQRDLRFLGYVTQQHKERTDVDKIEVEQLEVEEDPEISEGRNRRIVQAYQDISAGFPNEIRTSLGGILPHEIANPHLGDIRHLGSLAPKSQSQHVPMISVRGTGSYTKMRKQAREIYRDIANRFLSNLQQAQER